MEPIMWIVLIVVVVLVATCMVVYRRRSSGGTMNADDARRFQAGAEAGGYENKLRGQTGGSSPF